MRSSFYCAREAAKDMMRREEKGSIVLIGSMSGAAVSESPFTSHCMLECFKRPVLRLPANLVSDR